MHESEAAQLSETDSLLFKIIIDLFAICSAYSWRRQWHPTPVLLPGKSYGRRTLEGCSLWGRTESQTMEVT